MISWQECFSCSEQYFPDKVAVFSSIDHYKDNIVSYFCDLHNKLQKKQLTMDQFIVKGQKRKVSNATFSCHTSQPGLNQEVTYHHIHRLCSL